MNAGEHAFTIRLAQLHDIPALEELIAESVRVLQASDYDEAQREAALRTVYGVDTQLIRDRTCFVVEAESGIIGCGGWSRRKTLYGGDRHSNREESPLNPDTDAARVRAFFVRPGWERRGVGSAILRASEAAAIGEGFTRLELGSTLTGVPFYRAFGYAEAGRVDAPLENGLTLPVIRMTKTVSH